MNFLRKWHYTNPKVIARLPDSSNFCEKVDSLSRLTASDLREGKRKRKTKERERTRREEREKVRG